MPLPIPGPYLNPDFAEHARALGIRAAVAILLL